MKNRYLLFYTSVLWGGLSIIPLPAQESPLLLPAELPGLAIIRSDSFDGPSLWGYINGGADVYLEYGFERVWVQETETPEGSQKVDIYRMSEPAAAFGIYTISSFRCPARLAGMDESCVNPFQVQFRKGNFYVSVQNSLGTEAAGVMSRELALRISGKLSGQPHPFPWLESFMARTDLHIVYVTGRLGLENGIPSWPLPPGEENGFGLVLIRMLQNNSWIAWLESSDHERSVMAENNYLSMIPQPHHSGTVHARDIIRINMGCLLFMEHTGPDDPIIPVYNKLKENITR